MPIIRKIGKLGYSFDVRIPPEIMDHLRVGKGNYVVWEVNKKGQVILEKLTPKKHPGFFLTGVGWLKRGK